MEGKDFIDNDIFVYKEDDSQDEDEKDFNACRQSIKILEVQEKEKELLKTQKKDPKKKAAQQ